MRNLSIPAPDPDDKEALRAELTAAHAAAREAYRVSTTLVRLLTVIGQPIPPQALIDETLIALSELYTAGVACIVEVVGDQLFVRDACGVSDDDPAFGVGWPSSSWANAAIEARQPIACRCEDEPLVCGLLGDRPASGAIVPLGGNQPSDQLLMLLRSVDQPFTAQDLQVLGAVAGRLQVSLEARRRGVVMERLEQAALELMRHLDQVMNVAPRQLREITDADFAWLATLTNETAVLRAHDGVSTAFTENWPRPIASLPGWSALRAGQPVSTAGGFPGLGDGAPVSVSCVPLTRDGRPTVLLFVGKHGVHGFAPEVVEAIGIFGRHLDAAIVNAKLYRDLGRSEASLRLITDSINDMVAVVDECGVFQYASPSYERQLGLDVEELIGREVVDFVSADDRELVRGALVRVGEESKVEYRVRDASGALVWVETAVRHPAESLTGRLFGTVLSSRVVDERKRLEDELRHRALHDPLTGLANRSLVTERLERLLAEDKRVGVLFCDIDKFKSVNDRLGHEAGDELLQHVTERLLTCIRPRDMLARFGGDEFVVVLDRVGDHDTLRRIADRVLRALDTPITLGREAVRVTVSVGAVLGEGSSTSASAMVRDADAAMYVAKQRGGGDVEVFDAVASHQSLDRLSLASEVVGAAARGELALHYQPSFDLETNGFTVLEALVRWTHPTRGPIPPDKFIPLAEENGAIVGLGQWVLREACQQLARWHRAGARDIGIAVNASVVELQHEGYAKTLLDIIDESGVRRKDIWVEITERGYLYETAIRQIAELRTAGVRFALDDFGMSYSNFSFLKRHAIECLKIDRSLVNDVTDGGTGRSIVAAIMALGSSLQVPVVAEGIETPQQRDALLDLGCRYGQGYLLARPLPADAMTRMIGARVPRAS